jgi:thiol-disulfide isomerase/thioredoxin
VKQGRVLSPILFIAYFDEMFISLRKNGVGCHIGPHYMEAFGYADDAALVAPTCGALQKMLLTCEEFAKEYRVKFNPKKSMCLKTAAYEYDTVSLNGHAIQWVESARHLGNMIDTKLTHQGDCAAKLSAFYGSVNKLVGLYGGLDGSTLCKFFNSFCCSFYGSSLWSFNASSFDNICVQWNKAVRRILNLPYRTHT